MSLEELLPERPLVDRGEALHVRERKACRGPDGGIIQVPGKSRNARHERSGCRRERVCTRRTKRSADKRKRTCAGAAAMLEVASCEAVNHPRISQAEELAEDAFGAYETSLAKKRWRWRWSGYKHKQTCRQPKRPSAPGEGPLTTSEQEHRRRTQKDDPEMNDRVWIRTVCMGIR